MARSHSAASASSLMPVQATRSVTFLYNKRGLYINMANAGAKRWRPVWRGSRGPCCKRKEFDFVCSFGSMDKQVAPASSENLHQAMALGGRSIYEDRDARIPSWPGTEVVPLRGRIYWRRPLSGEPQR